MDPHPIAKDLRLDPPLSLSLILQPRTPDLGSLRRNCSGPALKLCTEAQGANLGWGNQESRHYLFRT